MRCNLAKGPIVPFILLKKVSDTFLLLNINEEYTVLNSFLAKNSVWTTAHLPVRPIAYLF